MSKNYISVEHAIRNIVSRNDKTINVNEEDEQLDEFYSAGVALSRIASGLGKALKIGDDIVEIPRPAPTQPRPSTPVKPAPAQPKPSTPVEPAPAQPKPSTPVEPAPVVKPINPAKTKPSSPARTGVAPATNTTTKTGTGTSTGRQPQTRTGGSRTGGSSRTGTRTGTRTGYTPGASGETPGQDISISASGIDANWVLHTAGERRVGFDEAIENERSKIENVARPNTNRKNVMSRNESIIKQVIDETIRRKLIIKDAVNNSRNKDKGTVNLKPETNDAPSEVNEQIDKKLADAFGLDPKTGAVKRTKQRTISPSEVDAARRQPKGGVSQRSISAGEELKQKVSTASKVKKLTADQRKQARTGSKPPSSISGSVPTTKGYNLKGKLSNLVGGKLGGATAALGAGLDYYLRRQRGESIPRALGGSATSALGGILGGAGGALVGAPAGPVGSFAGSVAGGAAGFYGASKAYDTAMDKLFGAPKPPEQSDEQQPSKLTADQRKQARTGKRSIEPSVSDRNADIASIPVATVSDQEKQFKAGKSKLTSAIAKDMLIKRDAEKKIKDATSTNKTDVAAWSPSTPRPWAAGLDKMGDVKAAAAQEVKQQKSEKAEASKAALPTNKIANALQQKREKTKKVTPEVKQQSPKNVGNFTGGFGQTATYGVNQPGAFKRGGLYDTRGR